jgi:hypothetical protein
MSEELYQSWRATRSDGEGNNTMEWSGSLVFAEDSIFLSIYDLAYLKTTLVIAHERDMIKGI